MSKTEKDDRSERARTAQEIGHVQPRRDCRLDARSCVADRNSDDAMIIKPLGWEPGTPLCDARGATCGRIEQQHVGHKAGKRTVRRRAACRVK